MILNWIQVNKMEIREQQAKYFIKLVEIMREKCTNMIERFNEVEFTLNEYRSAINIYCKERLNEEVDYCRTKYKIFFLQMQKDLFEVKIENLANAIILYENASILRCDDALNAINIIMGMGFHYAKQYKICNNCPKVIGKKELEKHRCFGCGNEIYLETELKA